MFEGRIARFDAPGQPFRIQEVSLAGRGILPGEILIRVTRANVCGSDLHAWHGNFDTRGLGGKLPTVLGHEMVGRVAALGEGTGRDTDGKPLESGTRVVFPYFFGCHVCRYCVSGRSAGCARLRMAMLTSAAEPPHYVGAFGDYFVLPPGALLYTVPDTLSDEVVSGANCALSQVMHSLDRAHLAYGETVVVQGAGGLGLYATALAKARGARTVIVLDAVAERLDLAREMGADATVDITAETDARSRIRKIQALTDGGADVVVELVGSPSVVDEGIRMLGRFGRYLSVGNIGAKRTYEADPSRLTMTNKSVIGVSLYEPAALGRSLAFLEAVHDRLPKRFTESTVFPLDAIDEAFRAADHRDVVRAAIVP
ncbi:zinc-binding dehydrogenase [Embleya hyalina]|uniref:2-deoxy-scyllo-inosamine dehydrogenase n=1 Tax=Embleya hyalina TaxID=516124 RepID=A0A401YMY9_9ACTN|nr:zinc-binding dehydrogenase [Embleya hyalina]GCD95951.1 zinc-binding alcohol dehydrogenase [Embleya hyalina]